MILVSAAQPEGKIHVFPQYMIRALFMDQSGRRTGFRLVFIC